MMKKNGFTLAEVLITLAIIGVVATLTLPSLMTNTAEQQAITSFKKIMNTLNEAGQMNSALEGFDYSISDRGTDIDDHIENGVESLISLFNERLQVSREASGGYGDGDHCSADPVLVLRDGTAICLSEADATFNEEDGEYWTIWVDTNAQKGPNKESTCAEEGCTTKSSRSIHDQFPVTLSKGIAVPGHWSGYETENDNDEPSFAARYAMGIGKRAQAQEGG